MSKLKSVLFITHDCTLTGAPLVLEYVINHFISNVKNVNTYVSCIDTGYVSSTGYQEWVRKYNCFKINQIKKEKKNNFESVNLIVETINPDLVYGNTILSIPHLVIFKKLNPNITTTVHFHENEDMFNYVQSDIGNIDVALDYIDKFIVVSEWQLKYLLSKSIPNERIIYTPECIDTDMLDIVLTKKKTGHSKKRVIGIGTPSIRKGLDRFIEVAKQFNPDDYEFIWIGNAPKKTNNCYITVEGYNIYNDVVVDPYPVNFVGELKSVYDQVHQSDIFLLLSREDPCPLVVLESLYLGLGVVTLKSSGDSHLYVTPHDEVLNKYNVNDVIKSIIDIQSRLKDRTIQYNKNTYHRHLKNRVSVNTVCSNILSFLSIDTLQNNVFERLNSLITYVFIDDLYTDRCLKIIDDYVEHGITNIKLFTSKDISSPYVVKINPINSTTEYSHFVLKELNDYIDTEFCLISQWDGFIINYNAWDNNFLNYDYIGAPWFWKYDKVVGGNGGFSLRSKKLMNEIQYIPYDGKNPEDEFICEIHGPYLVKNGFKFPTPDFARKFSVENEMSNGSFGFHNFSTSNNAGAQKYYKMKFHHSGDLGDVIYSLPFIKKLGGGVLVLTPNYYKMDIRCPMTYDKAMTIRELLKKTPYLYDIQFSLTKPVDVDYDLNDFRKIFTKWGEGRFSEKEVEQVRRIPLTQLYRQCIDPKINVDFDQSEWLNFDKKVVDGKPIVVNRTERYHNKNFPWKSIVNDYCNQIIFVGTSKEHSLFVEEFGHVDYYKTDRMIDLANILSGGKLFIGNQSFPYSLVEGMKLNSIQETSIDLVPNCMYRRYNSYLTDTKDSVDYKNIKMYIDKYISL
jgi:glycosyltransferase involved in cell wall biosynthesis